MTLLEPDSKYPLNKVPNGAYIDLREELYPQHLVDQQYRWNGRGWQSREYRLVPLAGTDREPFWLEVEYDEDWKVIRWRSSQIRVTFDHRNHPRTINYADSDWHLEESGTGHVVHVSANGNDSKGEVRYYDYADNGGRLLCIEIFPDCEPEVFIGERLSHLSVTSYGKLPQEDEGALARSRLSPMVLIASLGGAIVLLGLCLLLLQLFT